MGSKSSYASIFEPLNTIYESSWPKYQILHKIMKNCMYTLLTRPQNWYNSAKVVAVWLKVLNGSDRIQIAIGFYIEFYWGQEKAGKTIWNNFNFRKEFLRQEIKQIFDGSRKFYFVKICM